MDICSNDWHVSLHCISWFGKCLLEIYWMNIIVSLLFFQLPTLLADGNIKLKRFLVINSGFLFGITVMFLLALFEDKIKELSIK